VEEIGHTEEKRIKNLTQLIFYLHHANLYYLSQISMIVDILG